MMQAIRSRAGKIMAVLISVGFVAWMVFELGMDVTSSAGGSLRPEDAGRINGRTVSAQEFDLAYQNVLQQYRAAGRTPRSAEEYRQLREDTWDQLVNETLVAQEMAERGIRVTDDEIRQAALSAPPPQLMGNELFLTDGRFDPIKYQQFLAGPTVDDQFLRGLEDYYRQTLPRVKLARQISAGAYVTDAEIWQAFRDREETVTVEFVPLDLAVLAPDEVEVTEAEIRRYYDEHPDRFERDATARFDIAYLPTAVDEQDRADALRRAEQVRSEIVDEGADFAEVAQRESADPGSAAQGGDLGTFGRGQMVEAFDSAVFSLPIDEISAPVETPFGYHLIQVRSRDGDEATARHILIPVEKTDAALDRLDAKADSLEALALDPGAGLERAARAVGATFRPNVAVNERVPFVPGVGSILDAVQWARQVAEEEGAGAVSEIFDTDQAAYVVQLRSFSPAGRMPLAEATDVIRRELVLQKKREVARAAGEELVAAVRGGTPLAEAAAARGLQVQTAGPFSRAQPNAQLGQSNAAVGAAFGTPVGRVSDVAATPAGLFVIRPTAREEADRAEFEAQKENLRTLLTQRMEQARFERWLRSVREEAEIEDNTDALFLRS